MQVVEVHVTESGQEIFSTIQEERQARLGRLLAEIGSDELAALLTGLRAVREARDKLHATDPEEHGHGK